MNDIAYVPSMTHPAPPTSKPKQILAIVNVAGTPVRLAPVGTYFRKAWIFGLKAVGNPPTANVTDIYLGPADGATQPETIAPTQETVLGELNGPLMDLFDWFISAGTNNDGVIIEYIL